MLHRDGGESSQSSLSVIASEFPPDVYGELKSSIKSYRMENCLFNVFKAKFIKLNLINKIVCTKRQEKLLKALSLSKMLGLKLYKAIL